MYARKQLLLVKGGIGEFIVSPVDAAQQVEAVSAPYQAKMDAAACVARCKKPQAPALCVARATQTRVTNCRARFKVERYVCRTRDMLGGERANQVLGDAINENLSDLIEDISAKTAAIRDGHTVEPAGPEGRFAMPEWAGPACVGLVKQQAPHMTWLNVAHFGHRPNLEVRNARRREPAAGVALALGGSMGE